MNRCFASFLVFLGSASYGLLSTATKLAYQHGFSTAQVVGSQMVFGCLGFWLSSHSYWQKTFSLSLREIILLATAGAMSGLTGVFYYLSLKALPASYAVILLFQFTWMGIGFDYLFNGKKPSVLQLAAAAVIMAGTTLAVGYSTAASAFNLHGVSLGLLSALTYTLFIYFSGSIVRNVPTIVRNNWMVSGAAAAVLLIFPPYFFVDGSLSSGLLYYGGFLGLFGILIPFYLFAKGVPHIGPGKAALLGAIELPVVIICSFFLLKEQLGFSQLAGIGIILIGILLSVVKK